MLPFLVVDHLITEEFNRRRGGDKAVAPNIARRGGKRPCKWQSKTLTNKNNDNRLMVMEGTDGIITVNKEQEAR